MVSIHPADETKPTSMGGDIAIVGMACLFPGAPDLDTYWHNIISKVDAVTDPPPESWDPAVFYDPTSDANDRVYCKRGGFISPLAYFDPVRNGIMPRTVEGGEPDQWLALQVARAAFADAGYVDEIPQRERTAVIIGKGTYLNRGNLSAAQHGIVTDQTLAILKTLHPEFSEEDLLTIRAELKQQLPPFNADTASGLIPNILAGRIANQLDLMGPSYTVDAACASSLIALDIAVRDLLTHRCDAALVGGSHVVTPVPVLMLFCQLGALSRRQQIRPFDRNADGTILGEGVGMVVLKRRGDAERDGNRIYAIIKGVGTSSDGRGTSVMAPRLEGQVEAMRRAYQVSGVMPRTVGLIEAHGTATLVGDATEARALTEVFGLRGDTPPRIGLGSVKSMISHLMPAAGIAALIKTALALYHKVLPPTLNVDEPNPELHLEQTPFYINTETRPWIHAAENTPRRAGVSAFGFGGVNAHVVLEEAPPTDLASFRSRQRSWDSEVFLLRGHTRRDLVDQTKKLAVFLERAPDVPLRDLAFTLNVTRVHAPESECLSLVASGVQDLRGKLDRALEKLADPRTSTIKTLDGIYWTEQPLGRTGTLAFLFPGEGSQYLNMLADLCIHFPEVRAQFDLVDRIFAAQGRDLVLSDYLFPPPAFDPEAHKVAEERIWRMEGAVEAVLTANRALGLLLERLQIRPAALVGHSTGEYSAMLASGMIRADDEPTLSEFALGLNRFHHQAAGDVGVPRAALLAVGADLAVVTSAIAEWQGQLFVAMANCPHQTVIAGPEGAIAAAVETLHAAGLITDRLPFDRPYHTPLFEAIARRLEPFSARWLTNAPRIKTYSCTTSAPFPADPARAREVAVEHWLRPVDFTRTVDRMYADGVRIFVEVGPRGNLTTFVNDILRNRSHLVVPANVMHRSGLSQLNHLVAMLAAHAVPMSLEYLYRHRDAVKLDLLRPEDPYHAGPTRGKPLKLATGWPPMRLAEETAAQMRSRLAPIPAASQVEEDLRRVEQPVSGASARQESATAAEPPKAAAPARPISPSVLDGGKTPASQVMVAHLQTMEQFLVLQEDVMQAFLAGRQPGVAMPGLAEARPPVAANSGPRVAQASLSVPEKSLVTPEPQVRRSTPEVELVPSVGTPQESAATSTGSLGADAIAVILTRLVSERTGYPPEMLDFGLDLEASLGIDSIKRVEILGLLRKEVGLDQSVDMEALASRKTLQGIVDFLSSPVVSPSLRNPEQAGVSPTAGDAAPQDTVSSPAPAPPNRPSLSGLPFLREVVSCHADSELTARCQLCLEEDLFLLDHTLGRSVSVTDPGLRGLPVMPFTMSMEMLAEVATALMPGLHLVGMRDVRANRWIALDGERLTVDLVARREPADSGTEVRAQLYELDPEGKRTTAAPFAEGTIIFGTSYPQAPAVKPFALAEECPSRWQPEQLYTEVMFHGPLFRGVRSIDRTGRDGAVATVATKARQELFRSTDQPALVTDPVLLDQPGQVVGFWTAEHLDTGHVIFPFHLKALHFYRAMPDSDQTLECRARIGLVGEHQVRSDLEVVDRGRGLIARFEGWEDQRFDLPDAFHRLLMSPRDAVLSESWPALASLTPELVVRAHRADQGAFAESFFTAHGGIWQRTLACLILSPRERAIWQQLERPEHKRIEWLLARLAAKDAVRRDVKDRYGLILAPADVEILPDGQGRPIVGGSWLRQTGGTCRVSIAHTAGMALAVAVESAMGIGVDIERMAHMRADVSEVAFTSHEKAQLGAEALVATDDWPLRLWCAKEAAAKAIGRGMLGGPQNLEAQAIDPARGTIEIALKRTMVGAAPEMNGKTLMVGTLREGDFVAALAVVQS